MHNALKRWLGVVAIGAGALTVSSVYAKAPQAGEWTSYENLAPVNGPDGRIYTASCSGYPGTDPAFKFWAKKGASKNLVVYFEGGGACWDNLTCTFPIAGLPPQVPQFFVPQVAPGTNPATYSGLFDQSNAANPVKDWSIVYIPYCTGDIHTGSATRTYTSVGHPVLGLPAGAPITIQHRGFDNFMVVLDWIRKNVDDPKSILVTGSSAGGYGATANFPYVAEAYPNAHMYVVADAAQGVTTPAFDSGTPGRDSWNPQLPQWVFGAPPLTAPSADLLRRAAEAYPRAKISQFTTTLDSVQIAFYGVMKQFYGPGGSCPSPVADWNQQMLGTLAEYGGVRNFRYYLAGGTYHTLLRSPTFYTENSPGVTYADWLGQMLANRGGTGGAGGGWNNVACPGCQQALPCQ